VRKGMGLVGAGLGVACASICVAQQAMSVSPQSPQDGESIAAFAARLARESPEVGRFVVREGYEVSVAVPMLDNARFMEFGEDGVLYVSRPRVGDIVACRDADGDGVYEDLRPVVSDHESVHGLCWHDGQLWFSTTDAIWRTQETGEGAREVVPVISDLPAGGTHWWRSILVTDEFIYTSIGDSGNIDDETQTDRQKIWRFTRTGADKTLFASGVRNTEKLRLRPGTQEVWGIDHGSDWFGRAYGETEDTGQPITDWYPPDELNRYEMGGFYGHPFIVGHRLPRKEWQEKPDIVQLAAQTTVPAWSFGAHWAANSFTFVNPEVNRAARAAGGGLPSDHEGDMFVACRGSWNRTERAGYRVVRVMFDKDATLGGSPFGMQTIVGTLVKDGAGEDEVLARPVDCVQAPDGSILFSSDAPRGRVYRIRAKR
jgi:glucose/arabinose dehydrogenase